jgi:nitrogen fixation protein NifU and related proteins
MTRPPPSEPNEPGAPSAASAAVEALYQDRILEHFRRPHGKGTLEHPDAIATISNPLCGESVSVAVTVERSPESIRVRDVRFQSDGCSIAQASASMMTDLVRGHTPAEIEGLAASMQSLVSGDRSAEPDQALGAALALAVVARVPARIACAMLAWRALIQALRSERHRIGAPGPEGR